LRDDLGLLRFEAAVAIDDVISHLVKSHARRDDLANAGDPFAEITPARPRWFVSRVR